MWNPVDHKWKRTQVHCCDNNVMQDFIVKVNIVIESST